MKICIIGHALTSQAILQAMAGKNFDAILALNGLEGYSKGIESENKPNPRPLFGKCPDDVFRKHKRRF